MKQTVAYFLLVVYIIALCKPVLPLLQDGLAHLFWKAQHIGTVHHHHGHHHAEKTVAATHENKTDSTPANAKSSPPVSAHLAAKVGFRFLQPEAVARNYSSTESCFRTSRPNTPHRPPKLKSASKLFA